MGLRRPPVNYITSELFDCVHGFIKTGNNTSIDMMYSIFDNYQSYPEYIVHFVPDAVDNPNNSVPSLILTPTNSLPSYNAFGLKQCNVPHPLPIKMGRLGIF